MIFTPGQLSRRADFYYQLGQLTAAGLGVTVALQQLRRTSPSLQFQTHLAAALLDLETGASVSESFRRRPDWLPAFDIALLHAGERSGRLDATFAMLAHFYQDRAAMARKLVSALMYPAFLLHFALFILPFAELFKTGDFVSYLLKTVGVLIPIYALVGVGIFLSQGKRGEAWRSTFETLTARIPFVGSGRRQLALARLAAALEAMITCGETILEAWPQAAAASGSPALGREVDSWRPQFALDRTPAEVLRDSRVFPDMFSNLYTSGEITGSLDVTLRRLRDYYADEGSRDLHSAARIGPGILYALVAGYIAWQVVHFYLGYFNQINQVIDGK